LEAPAMSTLFLLSYIALWIIVIFQWLVLLGLTRAAYRQQPRSLEDLVRLRVQSQAAMRRSTNGQNESPNPSPTEQSSTTGKAYRHVN
jgi:hypothetical protein